MISPHKGCLKTRSSMPSLSWFSAMPLGEFRNSSTNSIWSRIGRSGCKAKNLRTQTPPPALSSVPREKCGLFCCERVGEHGRGLNPAAHQPSQAPWLLEAGAAACLQPRRRGAPGEVKSVVAQPPLNSQGLRVEAPLAGWRSRLLATSRRC